MHTRAARGDGIHKTRTRGPLLPQRGRACARPYAYRMMQ